MESVSKTVTAKEIVQPECQPEISGIRALDKPLFSRIHPSTGRYAEAQGHAYRQALKEMAVHFGLSSSLYSGKSTRKGGSTSMHMSGRSDADMLNLAGHAQIKTTVVHYVKDVGHQGNTFHNDDDGHVTLSQLKRSLPIGARITSSGPSKVNREEMLPNAIVSDSTSFN